MPHGPYMDIVLISFHVLVVSEYYILAESRTNMWPIFQIYGICATHFVFLSDIAFSTILHEFLHVQVCPSSLSRS